LASAYDQVMEWTGAGALAPERVEEALEALEARPDAEEWRRAGALMLLWMGVAALSAGVIFFFAYNWSALGRIERLGLAQVTVLGALAAYVRVADRPRVGPALLFGVAMTLGALLALVGQTYQTGADIWELFALWAALITPLAVLGRSAAVWGLWAVLVNIAVGRWAMHERAAAVGLGCMDAVLLAVWVAGHRLVQADRSGVERLLYTMATVLLAGDMCAGIVEEEIAISYWLGALWWVASYVYYRRVRVDLYMLSWTVVSMIVVVTTLMVRGLAEAIVDSMGLVLIGVGLVVVVVSVMAALWLKAVSAEVRR
jgi:uncharacterized membrane protein